MMPIRRWWTEAEVIALTAGVKRHGAGKWVYILRDLDFGPHLRGRTNIDLKDKWRSLQRAKKRQAMVKAENEKKKRAALPAEEGSENCAKRARKSLEVDTSCKERKEKTGTEKETDILKELRSMSPNNSGNKSDSS